MEKREERKNWVRGVDRRKKTRECDRNKKRQLRRKGKSQGDY
jgi:hypothetical protein